MPVDLVDDAFVEFHVMLVLPQHTDQSGAHFFSFVDGRACLDAEGLGLVTGRDGAGCVGHHRHHGHRLAAQAWVQLLLHAGEIAVEVHIQPAQAGRRDE